MADPLAWRAPWTDPAGPPPHAPIPPPPHPTYDLDAAIRAALEEDAGDAGDLTTSATIPAGTPATATFTAKAVGTVAGLGVADAVFRAVDPAISPTWLLPDGASVSPGTLIGTATGPAASLLIAERVALNFMQRMGGIATATAAMAGEVRRGAEAACAAPSCTLLDTRKTAPGLRLPDKWAVLIGGGSNHRMGLYDMVMVKDNHAAAAGGVGKAAAAARARLVAMGRGATPLEVEARTLGEVEEILAILAADPEGCGITRLMLDNMVSGGGKDGAPVDTSALAAAVARVKACPAAARLETEASGGVTLASVAAIAATGVSHISCGAITHSSPALDISMGLVLG